jgi:hypothetical protein
MYALEHGRWHITEDSCALVKKATGYCMHMFDAEKRVRERPDTKLICCDCLHKEQFRKQDLLHEGSEEKEHPAESLQP